MNVVLWISFGLMAGAIINILRPKEGGIGAAMIVGALGAVAGGILSSVVFDYKLSTFALSTFIVSAMASILVLYLERVFVRKSR